MKNKASVKVSHPVPTPASVTVSVPAESVVIPAEFHPIPGMNNLTLAAAAVVAQKNPGIVTAAVELRDAMGKAGEKFFGIASQLRTAKLVKKEATMLLHALGFSASRTSEMIKLSSVSDEIWNKYSAGSVGFRAAMQLENGPDEGEGGGEGKTSTGGKKRQAHKAYPVPKGLAALVNTFFKEKADELPMKAEKRTEYFHTVELGDGKFLHFTIFSDKE